MREIITQNRIRMPIRKIHKISAFLNLLPAKALVKEPVKGLAMEQAKEPVKELVMNSKCLSSNYSNVFFTLMMTKIVSS